MKTPIRIGGLHCRTSFLSSLGEETYRATVLALKQVEYKVAGRSIELITEDIASDPTTGLEKTRKLVETDRVDLITGITYSVAIDAIGPFISEKNVPLMITSCAPQKQGMADWPMWAPAGLSSQMTYATGVYAYDELGYRTTTTLSHDIEDSYIGGFIDGFTSRGGKVIQQQWCPMDTSDFVSYLSKAKTADLFAYWVVAACTIPIIKQIQQVRFWDRMDVLTASDSQLFDGNILREAGDSAIGMIGEMHYSSLWNTPGNKEYVQAFKKKWGVDSGTYGGMAYTSMQIILDALERTGGDASFEVLSKALDDTDFNTIRGRITFTAKRLGVCETFIMKCKARDTIEQIARYETKALSDGEGFKIICDRLE